MLGGNLMSIHKDERNPKKWIVIYKNRKKRGFDSKREAMLYESKLKLENSIVCSVRYSIVCESYLDDLKNKNAYGTYLKSKQAFDKYILKFVKDKRMSAFTELDCKKFREQISSLKLATVSKNYILNKFIAIFKYAKKYYALKTDVYLVIEPFKRDFNEVKRSKERIEIVWDTDEFNRFIECVKIKKYKLLFTTLYFTGMRLGEALALTWNDLGKNSISINKSVTPKTNKGTYEIKAPKTVSAYRNIFISKSLISLLNEHKEYQKAIPGFNESWFIFGNINPLPRTNIERVKNKGVKESGVRLMTIHGFRHSHASNLIASGVNIVAVSKRLGHSSVKITLEIYTHLTNKSSDEIEKYLEKNFPISFP